MTFGSEQYAGVAAFKGDSLLTWNAAISGGDVLALAVSGSNIYVGGAFTKVGDTTRNGLASLTANTDAAATLNSSWDAALTAGAEVHALAANTDNVYAGGDFTRSRSREPDRAQDQRWQHIERLGHDDNQWRRSVARARRNQPVRRRCLYPGQRRRAHRTLLW